MPPTIRDVQVLLALKDAREQARHLVHVLDREAITALCETAQNVIIGNIPTTPQQLAKLRQYKKELLLITRSSTTDATVAKTFERPGLVDIVLDVAKPTLQRWNQS